MQAMQPIMMMLVMFGIFYFILIRPQQTKQKEHRAMIDTLSKGDKVVTGGGIVGKVVRVDATDGTLAVEVAPNTQIKVLRHTVADLMNKPVPASGNDNRPAAASMAGGGFLGKLLGRK